MSMEGEEVYIGARVPRMLKTLIVDFVRMDTHINVSDFIRSAIREKLERDAPGLIKDQIKLKRSVKLSRS